MNDPYRDAVRVALLKHHVRWKFIMKQSVLLGLIKENYQQNSKQTLCYSRDIQASCVHSSHIPVIFFQKKKYQKVQQKNFFENLISPILFKQTSSSNQMLF